MSARRRTFALPFVITVAAGTACTGVREELPGNPPPPPEVVTPDKTPVAASGPATSGNDGLDVTRAGGEIAGASAGADPDTSTKSGPRTQTVQRPDGTCWLETIVECPEGVMCNPPPPRQVPCAEQPKPTRTVLAGSEIQGNGGACELMLQEPPCPPGDSCNPPPPETITCPPELATAHAAMRKQEDGSCRVFYRSSCRPGVRCNPPPPRTVPCPPELGG